MLKSPYIVIDSTEVAEAYNSMHAVYEEIVQTLFKNLNDDTAYTFIAQDGTKYTLRASRKAKKTQENDEARGA